MACRVLLLFITLLLFLGSFFQFTEGSPTLGDFQDCLASSRKHDVPYFTPYALVKHFNRKNRHYYIQVIGNLSEKITVVGGSGENVHAATIYSETYALGSLVTSTSTKLCDAVMDVHSFGVPIKCPWPAGNVSFMIDIPFGSTVIDYSKYELTSLMNRLIIVDGTPERNVIACVSFDLSIELSYFYPVIAYTSLICLAFVSFSVVYALFLNPWTGSLDPFRALFNFSMDPDALRLTALGFSDFIGYMQFAVSTSQLNVAFPKFYINLMAALSWSTVLFRFPIFSQNAKYQFADYTDLANVNKVEYHEYIPDKYGMSSFLDSLGTRQSCWIPFLIVGAVYFGAALLLALLIILLKWLMSKMFHDTIVETRWDTWSFIGGFFIRLYFLAYFPIISYMSYQFVIEPSGYEIIPVLLLIFLGIFFPGCLYLFLSFVEPVSKLFEDQTYLHLYGSIYNSYREKRLMFWVFPIVSQFIRGITVGVLGVSGSAQITIYFLLEVANLVAYSIFRPHYPQTNMNVLSCYLSVVRLIIVVLMMPLIHPQYYQSGREKLLTYAILFIHILVYVIFFLISTQRFFEISARLLGANSERKGVPLDRPFGWARVFGINELKRRRHKSPYENSLMAQSTLDNTDRSFIGNSIPLSPIIPASKDESPNLTIQTSGIGMLSSDVDPHNPGQMGNLNTESPVSPLSPFNDTRGYSFYRPPKVNRYVRQRDRDQLRTLQLDFLNEKPSLFAHDTNYAVREADVYHPQVDADADSLSQLSIRMNQSKPELVDPVPTGRVMKTWHVVKNVFQRIRDPLGQKEKNEEKGFVVVRSARRMQPPHEQPTISDEHESEENKVTSSTESRNLKP
ncbi:plasma membrane TRP-like calcium ion channel Trp1322 [Schizosaccharomyces osmophilus]|uniref:Plasma membrane TRP-like calcium ion channel Trp1322 n=1 Tax=Schizosaccharomyces osmophilus TaxID=2545709 RepID=A0AAF0B024_9SCHI|nr:plasma membrane TRP-like calcium ion channel Trp1322 [Schizosaccharomyces osmophilus]WBW75559.1 plasma membrane TRP-like calcium ion channel Trp1322 [Schizosaccharomyces osmophilus]